jgi:hypothetical protein
MISAKILSSGGSMRFVVFLSFLLFPLITVARAQVSAEVRHAWIATVVARRALWSNGEKALTQRRMWTATRAIVPMTKIRQPLSTTAIASP